MKISISFILLLMVELTSAQSRITEEPSYTLIKKDKGVSLYYRWIKISYKLTVRELKTEFDVHSSPENIITIIKNEKLAKQWMKGTSEINRLEKTSENQWHTYIQYNIPWPLNNQDCIVHYEVKREKSGKYFYINMTGVPSFIPEKDGITRIRHLQGTWKLLPVNNTSCKVTYTVYSGQVHVFPRWITDPIVQGNLINTMYAFKNTVEKNQN